MKTAIKTIFLILSVVLLSCDEKKTPKPDIKQPEVSKAEIPKVKPTALCFDTMEFKSLGIKWNKIDSIGWHLINDVYPKGNNKVRSMRWHGTTMCRSRRDLIVIDSIIVQLKNTFQTLVLPFEYSCFERDFIKPEIDFEDYNLDGQMDFRFFDSSSGTMGSMHEYFLFDEKKNKFSYSEEFSGFINLEVHKKSKELTTYRKGGAAGMIMSACKYKVIKGEPILIEQVDQDRLPDGTGRFLRKTTYPLRTVDTVRYDTIVPGHLR